MASVTGSGATQHAGENYTLTCTVSGGETTATTTYQWHWNNLPLSGATSATLSFTPLRQTSPYCNGQYVCEAMRSGRTLRSEGFTIDVTGRLECDKACPWHLFLIIAPPLTLVFTTSGPPIEGQTYSLTCDLMGDESLDVTATSIRWDRVTPTFQHGIHQTANLSFNPLSRDDEGQYRCIINITSPYTTSSLTEVETASFTVIRKQRKSTPQCEYTLFVGQCPPLFDPTNGMVMTTSTRLSGSTATYTCNSGFEILDLTPGVNVRTCQPDGTWSGSAQRCIRK